MEYTFGPLVVGFFLALYEPPDCRHKFFQLGDTLLVYAVPLAVRSLMVRYRFERGFNVLLEQSEILVDPQLSLKRGNAECRDGGALLVIDLDPVRAVGCEQHQVGSRDSSPFVLGVPSVPILVRQLPFVN